MASTSPSVYQRPAPKGFGPTGPLPAAATPKTNGPSSTASADMKTYPAAMARIASSQQPQAAPSALPPGWIEMKDPSGRNMFFNTATGQSSWQRPIVWTLPPGWQKSQTPDGKVIFIHLESGRCSYEWPAAQSHASDIAGATPLTQSVSAPPQPVGRSPGGRPPHQDRSQSMPSYKPQGSSLMRVNIDRDLARKVVPGVEEAYSIHQLSENNNCSVLSKALAHDIGVTSNAIKDTTIIAASLAARQAKTVTKMMKPSRMRKMSKKMVVHTGALGVKTGRACKGLMHEMVDAADKKGKYQPKQRQFMPDGIQPLQDLQEVFRMDQPWQSQVQQAANQDQMHPLSQAQLIPQKLVSEYEYAQPLSNIAIQYQTNWPPEALAHTPNSATQQPQGIPSSAFQAHRKSGLNFCPGILARKALEHQAELPESSKSNDLEATIPALAGMIISNGDAAGPTAARGNASAGSSTMSDVATDQVKNQKTNPRQISSSIAGPNKANLQNQANATGNSTSFAHPVRRATTGIQSSPQVQGPPQPVQNVNRGPANKAPRLSNPPAVQQTMGQMSSPRQVRTSIRPSITHPPTHQPSLSTSIHPQLTNGRPSSNIPPPCEQAALPQMRRPPVNRPAMTPSPGARPPASLMHPRRASASASHVSHSHSRPQAQPTPPVTDNSDLGAYQQNDYGDGMQQNDYGDGTQQNDCGDGTQQNDCGDGTQQNDYVDGTQQNNYGGGTQQNNYEDGIQQNSYGDGTQQNDYEDGTQQNDYVDVTQQNDYVDGAQQSDYEDGTQQNNYGDETQQNDYEDGTQQNDYVDVTQQNDYVDVTQQNDYVDVTQQNNYGDGTQQNDMDSLTTVMDQQNQVDYVQADTSTMQNACGADQATLVDQSADQQQMVTQDQDVGGGQNIMGGDSTYYQGIDQVDEVGQTDGVDQSGDATGYGVYTTQTVVTDDGMGGQEVYSQDTGAVEFADGSGYAYDYSCEVDVSGDTYAGDDCGSATYTGDDCGSATYTGDDCGSATYTGDDCGSATYTGDDCGGDTCTGDDSGSDLGGGDCC
jgi:WW domain